MNLGNVNLMEKVDGGILFITNINYLNLSDFTFKSELKEFFLPCENIEENVVEATLNRKDGVKITVLMENLK